MMSMSCPYLLEMWNTVHMYHIPFTQAVGLVSSTWEYCTQPDMFKDDILKANYKRHLSFQMQVYVDNNVLNNRLYTIVF